MGFNDLIKFSWGKMSFTILVGIIYLVVGMFGGNSLLNMESSLHVGIQILMGIYQFFYTGALFGIFIGLLFESVILGAILSFILEVIWLYFITCVIILIYQKVKEREGSVKLTGEEAFALLKHPSK